MKQKRNNDDELSQTFRSQALTYARSKYTRRSVSNLNQVERTLVLFIVLLVFFLVLSLLFVRVPLQVTASGTIIAKEGSTNIVSNREGVVEKVLTHQGQLVSKGDQLARLSRTRSVGKVNNIDQQIASDLMEREEDILARLSEETERWKTSIEFYIERNTAIEEQVRFIEGVLEASKKLSTELKVELESISNLERTGIVSRLELSRAKIRMLEGEMNVDRTKSQLSNLNRELISAKIQHNTETLAHANAQDALNSELRSIREKHLEITFATNQYLVSPIDGVVARLEVNEGEYIESGESIGIVLSDTPIILLEVTVSQDSALLISEGNSVLIEYSIFPEHRYGHFGGKVESISNSIVAIANNSNSKDEGFNVIVKPESNCPIIGLSYPCLVPGTNVQVQIEVNRMPLYKFLWAY